MDSNYKKLENTQEYSFSEIFSTPHRKIIIPDFQRDYCWGDKTHGKNENEDIISGFLETFKNEYNAGDTLLGKIDVYENPTNHIYLTDGQQRLTSLYLLVGMLYRSTSEGEIRQKLKKCLISEFEETDDKEPYLQYSIRESSVFFLRDLVNEFFLHENILKVADISKQPWYFNDYKLDPTIISMLKALQLMELFLNKKDNNINLNLFSDYIINRVMIQYYDVENRKHGEERFVIINTTGKSLTTTENVKPILLGNVLSETYSINWEERETWFWQNRDKEKKELVSDHGVNDFLKWCLQIIEIQDDIDLIKKSKELLKIEDRLKTLSKIDSLFSSLKFLIALLSNSIIQQQFKFINDSSKVKNIIDLRSLSKEKNQNIVLPLLAFIDRFGTEEADIYQFLRRLRKNYFDNKWQERKGNYVDWRHIIQIINSVSNPSEVLTFSSSLEEGLKEIPNVVNNISKWYNTEEKIKSHLKPKYQAQIQEWEDSEDFMGDLYPLFKVSDFSMNIEEIEKYYKCYVELKSPQNKELINEALLFRYCTDYGINEFGVHEVGWFRCIQFDKAHKMFNKEWFYNIWGFLSSNSSLIVENMRTINLYILKHIITRHSLDDLKYELNFHPSVQIELVDILKFENERVKNCNLSGNYAIATIFYWMFLEKIYDINQSLSIKNNCNQIGVRINTEEIQGRTFQFSNLKVATHYPGGKSVEYRSFELMKLISEMRKENKTDEIENLFDDLRKKLLNEININM